MMKDANARGGAPCAHVPAFTLISRKNAGQGPGIKRRLAPLSARRISSHFCDFRTVIILITTNILLMMILLHKSSLSMNQNGTISNQNEQISDSDQTENLAVNGIIRKHRIVPGIGVQSFIHMSGYRLSATKFAALGLAAAAFHMHRKAGLCRWQYLNGSVVNGRIELRYPGDSHGRRYDAIILFCTLTSDADSTAGGKLTAQIDGSDVAVLSENPSNSTADQVSAPVRSKLTLCSPPLQAGIDSTLVYEWLEFHRIIHGVDYFVLYDAGGVEDKLLPLLDHYISAERIEIVTVRQISKHDSWAHAQVLLGNDCLYRSKSTSEWVLLLDVDQYLTIPQQGGSWKLLDFLSRQNNASWMSFGSVVRSIHHCLQVSRDSGWHSGHWVVEKFVFREGGAYCRNTIRFNDRSKCLGWSGNRKIVVRPRNVDVITANRVVDSLAGGFDLSFSDIQVNWFVGLSAPNQSLCSFFWNPGTCPPRLVKDELVANVASRARKLDGIWGPKRSQIFRRSTMGVID